MTEQMLPLSQARWRDPGRTWEQTYPGTVEQVGNVRATLRPLLRDCPLADDVILAMSELAANAVRHSGSGAQGGTFTARVQHVPGAYVLGQVEDAGSGWDGDLERSARGASGLCVVLNIASSCGVTGDQWKRVVWFCMCCPADGHDPVSAGSRLQPTSDWPQVTVGSPDGAGHGAPSPLPSRRRSVQAPPSPLPQQQTDEPVWAAAERKVLEKVRVALRQM